jgi:hypothetical protein
MSESNFSDFWRDFEKSNIINENPELGIYFNNAIQSAINKLKKEIDETQSHYEESENRMSELSDEYEESGIPNQEDIEIMEDIGDSASHLGWLEENLSAIAEMKIVNLYKSLEIDTKHILNQIYENANSKQFYRWDLLMSFLKSNNIQPATLVGFTETNQLRLVNNQIKHGGELDNNIKNITEFNSAESFTFKSLENFLNRIEEPVNNYFTALSKEVYNDKYKFSDERLNKIVSDYKKRMDKQTLDKLIEKLG